MHISFYYYFVKSDHLLTKYSLLYWHSRQSKVISSLHSLLAVLKGLFDKAQIVPTRTVSVVVADKHQPLYVLPG